VGDYASRERENQRWEEQMSRATSLPPVITESMVMEAAQSLYLDKMIKLEPIPNGKDEGVFTVSTAIKNLKDGKLTDPNPTRWDYKVKGTLNELYNWLRAGQQ
jgi:hypothetical protein